MGKIQNPYFDTKFIEKQKQLLLKAKEQTLNDISQKSMKTFM